MRNMYRVMCAVLALLVFSCGSVKPAVSNPSMIADIDPFSIDSVTVWLEQTFSSKLKEVDVEVTLHPRKNEVILEFRHNMITHRLFWSEAARQQFRAAFDSYSDDFDNKRLVTDYRKSRAAYGKNTLRYEWETFKYSTTYFSTPPIEFGYRFMDKAVYFTVFLRSAKEESSETSRNNDSQQYSVYFTRAQAEELAHLFDQDYLLELVGSGRDALPPVDAGTSGDIYIP